MKRLTITLLFLAATVGCQQHQYRVEKGQVRTLRTLTALFVVYIWAIAALYARG